jgi:hypothetical protein
MKTGAWLRFFAFLGLAPACAIAAEPEWRGAQSMVTTPLQIIARDETEWQNLWQKIGGQPPQALPADRIGVAVFLGQKRSGGYSVQFTGQAETKDNIILRYRITAPSPTMMVTMALTEPYAVTLVPRSEKTIMLEEVAAPSKATR